MEVALITVGDELLAGDTTNTNATWLADQLTDRGATVARTLVLRDDRAEIADVVRDYSDRYDAVIVTGGIGGTPDDVTMEAVADAFDCEMAVSDEAMADLDRSLADLSDDVPDLDIDREAEASIPGEGRPILNGPGLAPGCVIENVYVFPGLPGELKAMFERVADEFEGDATSRFLYTTEPEANITPELREARERFDVAVGCYPDRDAGHNRLKLTGLEDEVEAAAEWLLDAIDASETPVEREWGDG